MKAINVSLKEEKSSKIMIYETACKLYIFRKLLFRRIIFKKFSLNQSKIKKIIVRSIYGLYIKSAPFFGDLKKIPETKNNSRFYILKLHFLLHYNRFSCPVTSLLNIALQSWCILFKIRKIDVFWPNRCFLLLS